MLYFSHSHTLSEVTAVTTIIDLMRRVSVPGDFRVLGVSTLLWETVSGSLQREMVPCGGEMALWHGLGISKQIKIFKIRIKSQLQLNYPES